MTHITAKFAGLALGIGLSLVALPLVAGAQSLEVLKSEYANHRFFFSEDEPWRTQPEATARYAMVQVSDLERIAGRTNLDMDTIRFLEDNLWDYDFNAEYQGETDGMSALEILVGRRYLDMDTIRFLEDNLWDYDMNATYEGEADDDGSGVFDVDPNDFSEEIPWQDSLDNLAIPAGGETERSALPYDAPQLRAEEPN